MRIQIFNEAEDLRSINELSMRKGSSTARPTRLITEKERRYNWQTSVFLFYSLAYLMFLNSLVFRSGQLYLANREKFHKEANKQYWKAIAEIIPREGKIRKKEKKKREKDAKDGKNEAAPGAEANEGKDDAKDQKDVATVAAASGDVYTGKPVSPVVSGKPVSLVKDSNDANGVPVTNEPEVLAAARGGGGVAAASGDVYTGKPVSPVVSGKPVSLVKDANDANGDPLQPNLRFLLPAGGSKLRTLNRW
ncbi:hypothetical protein C3L33_10468, partial [Rhododendron williamsianum]